MSVMLSVPETVVRVVENASQVNLLVTESVVQLRVDGPGIIREGRALGVDLKADFGAYGDGVHDDTSAIQAAAAALNGGVSGGAGFYETTGTARTLSVPAGTYCFTATVIFGPWIQLYGEGKGVSVFKGTGADARISMGQRGVSGNRGQALYGLTFDGNNIATNPLYLGRGSEAVMVDVEVIQSADKGIVFEEAQNTHILNLTSMLNAGDGLFFDYGASGIKIYGFEIASNGGWGVRTGTHGYNGTTNACGQNLLSGGIFEYSVLGSEGFVYIGQSGGWEFNDIGWADGTPLSDMTFIKLRQDVQGDVSTRIENLGILLSGWHDFRGAGPSSGYHTWLDTGDGVDLFMDGAIRWSLGFQTGIVWDGGSGIIDAHGYIADMEGGIFGTALVDNSGTGTNIDALVRQINNRGLNIVRYHEGTRRTFQLMFKHGDAQPQFKWTTDGKFWIGPGGSTAATAAFSASVASVLDLSARLVPSDSVTIKSKWGVPLDDDFTSTPANGTLALDTSTGHLYARVGGRWKNLVEDAMASTMVRVPFGSTNYVAEVNGSATATFNSSGATNLDGSATSLALHVPSDATRTGKHATVWVPFYGRAFGVRWARDLSATDRPDLSVVIDGVAYAVTTGNARLTAEGQTTLVDEAEAVVVEDLADSEHLAQIVVPAEVTEQNISLLGLILDERAAYKWGTSYG